MAAYRDCYAELEAADAQVVAVSVDTPEKSADLSASLKLPFPLLSDVRKDVLVAWKALNTKARGGIAFPSSWVIDRELVARYRVLERTKERVSPVPVLGFLRGELSPEQASELTTIGLNVQGSARWVKDMVSGALRKKE
ncbi:peroxiredoxin family protein [bacterium AH-315-N03]|nr:peroxiredoxin family protein [bacterium AH-315-N03]